MGEFRVGEIQIAEVELGFLAVERAVADEDDPERLRAGGFGGKGFLEALPVGLEGRGSGGLGGFGEVGAEFGRAGGADDDDDGRLGGAGGGRGGARGADEKRGAKNANDRSRMNHGSPFQRRRPHSAARQAIATRKTQD